MILPNSAVEVVEDSDLPSMDQSGVDTPGCDCGHEGMAAGWHLPNCSWLLAGTSAAKQQVAPKDPQVGRIRGWLDRLTGRHT